MNLKELKAALEKLQKQVDEFSPCDTKTCYDDCRTNCMHGVTDDEEFICYNISCDHYAGDCADHFYRCNKCIKDSLSEIQRRRIITNCCGFTRKNMPCNCTVRCNTLS